MTFQLPDFNEYEGGSPTPEETPDEPIEQAEIDPNQLDLGIELSEDEQLTADEVTRRLRESFGLDESPDTPGVPDEQADVPDDQASVGVPAAQAPVPGPGPGAPTPSAPAAIPAADPDLQARLELARILAANPQLAAQMYPALAPPPAPKEPEPPDWLDKEDPAQVHFWTESQETRRRLDEIAARAEQDRQAVAAQQRVSLVQQGFTNFVSGHPELSTDDIETIRNHAVELGIVDAMAAGRNPVEAVAKALELSYKDLPQFQASPTPPQPTEGEQRRQKLDGLRTSGGTTSRRPPAPKKAESDAEMNKQVAEYFANLPQT